MIAGYYTALERTLFCEHASDAHLKLWEFNCEVHRRGIALITSIGVSSGFLLPYFIGWVKDTTGTFVLAFVGIAATMVLWPLLLIQELPVFS